MIWEAPGPGRGIFGPVCRPPPGMPCCRGESGLLGQAMELERKFGDPVPGWTPPPVPGPEVLEGHYARLERLAPARHAADLHTANRADDRIWDYLPYGPFAAEADYRAWAEGAAAQADPYFYAILDRATGRARGVASFLRITPAAGSIEVGHINLAPVLQGTRVATEAMFLLADWVFSTGYRRYEWKCDALNLPSRRAAERLGFSYEGIFRQATVVKGRNRDTAWFAMIDKEWPALRAAYRAWLAPANFDAEGRQRTRLSDLTRPMLAARDPLFAT
jgi:RimJ/RimL family protein N-acetyltransferase